jgi:hypothetical protein
MTESEPMTARLNILLGWWPKTWFEPITSGFKKPSKNKHHFVLEEDHLKTHPAPSGPNRQISHKRPGKIMPDRLTNAPPCASGSMKITYAA